MNSTIELINHLVATKAANVMKKLSLNDTAKSGN